MKATLKKHVIAMFATFCLFLFLSIPVHAKTFEVSVGEEITLSFSGRSNQDVQWNISDSSKLSLVSTGSSSINIGNYSQAKYSATFKGVSIGSTEVTASNVTTGSLLSSATVKVTPPIDFKLNYDTIFLSAGKTFQLKALNIPAETSLIWKSDNQYATVSSTGMVTCVSPLRVTTVTCKTSDGRYSATCQVIGSIPTNTRIKSMNIGDSGKLTYSLNVLSNPGSLSAKWKSNKPGIVAVNSSGEIKALSAGLANITCEIGNRTLYYIVYVSSTPLPTPAPTATPKPTPPSSQKISIAKATVGSIKTQVYNGKIKKPAPVVSYNGKRLTASKDYVVQYWTNRYPGRAKCAIKGKGKYNGVKYVYFYISPQKQTIKSLVSSKSKTAILKFKKVHGQNGVQICYATNKSFKSAKYSTTTSTTKTISKLKSKKKYYFKIRAYKTVRGKKVYGPYSSVKSIKIK